MGQVLYSWHPAPPHIPENRELGIETLTFQNHSFARILSFLGVSLTAGWSTLFIQLREDGLFHTPKQASRGFKSQGLPLLGVHSSRCCSVRRDFPRLPVCFDVVYFPCLNKYFSDCSQPFCSTAASPATWFLVTEQGYKQQCEHSDRQHTRGGALAYFRVVTLDGRG